MFFIMFLYIFCDYVKDINIFLRNILIIILVCFLKIVFDKLKLEGSIFNLILGN